MFSIPLFILLGLYALFVLIFIIFVIISIYHLASSASITAMSSLTTLFLVSFGALVIYISLVLLSSVDWSEKITIFESNWFAQGDF